MPYVEQRSSRFVARWRDATGTLRARTFDTRAEAMSYAADQEGNKGPLTLGDWLEQWLVIMQSRVDAGQRAATTVNGYRKVVDRRLDHLCSKRLRDLTVADVDRLLTGIMDEGLAPRTANQARAVLSSALTDAMRADLVNRNVARMAAPARTKPREVSAFTTAEQEAIKAVCSQYHYGNAVLFALHTGMRGSEIAGLQWRDISGNVYTVSRTIHRVKGGLEFGPPKTPESGRPTPMSAKAMAVLGERGEPMQPVFPTSKGTHTETQALTRCLRAMLKRADVTLIDANGDKRGMHECRRTFATRLRDAGVPIEDAQRLGRWASPDMLLKCYAATPHDRLLQALNAV